MSKNLPFLGHVAVLAGVYFLTGHWSLDINAINQFAAPIWVPTGVSLAALFLFGSRLWPGVLLGALLVNIERGASPVLALVIGLGNTAEAIAAAFFLRVFKFDPSLKRLRDIFTFFVLAAVISTAISATVGSAALVLWREIPVSEYVNTLAVWWSGDILSNLVIAPFLLVWVSRGIPKERPTPRSILEVIGLAVPLFLISRFVFDKPVQGVFGYLPRPYLSFPVVLWAAFRYGPVGAVSATFLTAVVALSFTLQGLGPFALNQSTEPLFSFQLFVAVLALTAQVFAALATERSESREALTRSHQELEEHVERRTDELRRTNMLLRESEERFRLLVERVQDYAIYRLDATGHIVTWNSGAERTEGYRAQEILGQHFSRFFTSEDLARGKPGFLLAQAEREGIYREEGIRVRKDGSRFLADVVITAVRDESGQLKGFSKVIRDITERKRVEERLRRSQEQLMEAQRIAHLGSWEWDRMQSTVTWSDEMYRIFNLPPQGFRLLYRDIIRYIHPDDRRVMKQTLRTALRTHESFSTDLRIVLGDHETRYLHAFGKVVCDPAGQPVRLVGTAQDVTDQRHAEQALQLKEEELFQARKLEAIGRLAGGVAHDFNNLITGILGISQELKGTFQQNDMRRLEIEEIIKASNRAFDVTRQLLTFSRRQIITPKIININETIRDFARLLHRLIGEDIELDLHLSRNSLVKMDAGNLSQILLNLTLNARDAMPQGGRVSIRTANLAGTNGSGGQVLLEVTDTGKGMDEDTLSHIFEPFFTTKTKEKGTGLGLATVYGIVKQSGGDISVTSRVGQGATFKIVLPREISSAGRSVSPARHPAQREGHETVLVIEDEDIVRRVVLKQLSGAGYQVLEASGGKRALELVDQLGDSIDLVVTDVVMPEMNGRMVIERIHQKCPGIAVLYMSGYPQEIIAHRGTLDPGINFLEKSAIQMDLLKKVREVLDAASSAAPVVNQCGR